VVGSHPCMHLFAERQLSSSFSPASRLDENEHGFWQGCAANTGGVDIITITPLLYGFSRSVPMKCCKSRNDNLCPSSLSLFRPDILIYVITSHGQESQALSDLLASLHHAEMPFCEPTPDALMIPFHSIRPEFRTHLEDSNPRVGRPRKAQRPQAHVLRHLHLHLCAVPNILNSSRKPIRGGMVMGRN
jgi:hypothetical protein